MAFQERERRTPYPGPDLRRKVIGKHRHTLQYRGSQHTLRQPWPGINEHLLAFVSTVSDPAHQSEASTIKGKEGKTVHRNNTVKQE